MMNTICLCGTTVEIGESNIKILNSNEKSIQTDYCNGNACNDVDMQFDEDTRSYHFFNDGNRNVQLKVRSASVYGCNSIWKNRRMRPGDEWDSGFYGICEYEAKYR